MDTDGDPTAGIEISEAVAALFEGVSINLDQPWSSPHLSEVAFGVPEVPVHLQTKPELR
jgi:hypothetical protein